MDLGFERPLIACQCQPRCKCLWTEQRSLLASYGWQCLMATPKLLVHASRYRNPPVRIGKLFHLPCIIMPFISSRHRQQRFVTGIQGQGQARYEGGKASCLVSCPIPCHTPACSFAWVPEMADRHTIQLPLVTGTPCRQKTRSETLDTRDMGPLCPTLAASHHSACPAPTRTQWDHVSPPLQCCRSWTTRVPLHSAHAFLQGTIPGH